MASEAVIVLNESNFKDEVENSLVPVLVDFSATWCAPCKAVAPVFDQFANENQGKVKVCKVDIDDSPNLPAQLGIRGVPTFIAFKDGKEIGRKIGPISKTVMAELAGA